MSFANNIGKNAPKVAKNMSNKYSQKRLDSAKKSTTVAIKTASKRAIQKTAEATGDLIGNKIADTITSVSIELYPESSIELQSQNNYANNEIEVPKEETNNEIPKERYIYIYSEKKDNKLLMS